MKEVRGKYSTAEVFSDDLDEYSEEQIKSYLDLKISKGCRTAIMPDVHGGSGCVIGFTTTFKNAIIPNLIGVDIGCGVFSAVIDKVPTLSQLDRVIKEYIPSGFNINKTTHDERSVAGIIKTICSKIDYSYDKCLKSIGTLGGGNHFIELGVAEKTKDIYLTVHTGSRNFGHSIACYYQNKAKELMDEFNIDIPRDLAFIPRSHQLANDYLEAVEAAQLFAELNRKTIIKTICNQLQLKQLGYIESTHNYIDLYNDIIRKGAINSGKGRKVLIPLNMRDGMIVGEGLGNSRWNFSAPHGAGRIMSRKKAKEVISIEDFKKSMEGIYSSSVCDYNIDEAPAAYKDVNKILTSIKDTVLIKDIVKPIYNFKDSGVTKKDYETIIGEPYEF